MPEVQKFLDNLTGLPTLWSLIKNNFVRQESGKGLSSNDFTTELKTKLENLSPGDYGNQNAFSYFDVDGTVISAISETSTLNVVSGSNVTLTPNNSSKTLTIAATDTTYSDATTSTPGLMSTSDKTKLEGISSGAQVNTIESISVNGTAQTISSKNVDITVPTNNNQLTNGAGYQTAADVSSAISTAVASTYVYKGSVSTEANLPSSDLTVGWVYNITAASSYGPAGMNVAWTGTVWDALGSSIDIEAMTATEVTNICTFS